MPVRKGGWCIISKTGRAGAEARTWSSQASRAEHNSPPPSPGIQRVEGDEPDRVVLDRKLEKPVSRQITVSGKRGAQRLAGVVIAGNDENRHRERRKQSAQMLVFGGVAMIDEVAGHHRDIGQRVKPVDLSDRARQEFGGIDPAIEQLARRDDMRIGQLDNDHWLLRLLPLSPILCRQNANRRRNRVLTLPLSVVRSNLSIGYFLPPPPLF